MCCSLWGHRELDMTEQVNDNNSVDKGSDHRLFRAQGSAGFSPALKSIPWARPLCVGAIPGGSRASPLGHSVGAPGFVPDGACPQGHCSLRLSPSPL